MNDKVKYITEKETSNITSFALSTLRNQRHMGRGIPYIKAGKSVRYSFQDVVSFMEGKKILPAEAGL